MSEKKELKIKSKNPPCYTNMDCYITGDCSKCVLQKECYTKSFEGLE